MISIVPWASPVKIIQGFAPVVKSATPPFSSEAMFRLDVLQFWSNHRSPAI